jgi:hypothetical protein
MTFDFNIDGPVLNATGPSVLLDNGLCRGIMRVYASFARVLTYESGHAPTYQIIRLE